ncbi:MBL fold metallo-hydrolase, partial [Salmonella enterica]|uniref:MBL fold metallo-hydrolase n=1 Tax=Salmonella enterica TaxID=28901 RepID=UPI002FF7CF52
MDLADIDYIIINHAEEDHAGALTELMAQIPDTPIYCTVLIDTVDNKFSREFVQNLRSEIDLADIDYIIINHAEEDHAGALTELMAQIPDTPIYCTVLID